MRASVVIPAHDEEAVIARTLRALTEGLAGVELEIIVVCNGCRDRTAAIARAVSPAVRVEEIAEASKVAALNRGDELASAFPRIYLDADVVVSGRSVSAIVKALAAPGRLSAEPRPRMELAGCSIWVRRWYAVWLALHGEIPGKIGCGVVAVSEAGRARFASFPRVIADDLFARAHFSSQELQAVAGAEAIVRAPRTISDLIRIKTRSRLGSDELALRYPDLAARHSAGRPPSRRPWQIPLRLWPWIPFYLMTAVLIRQRAARQFANLSSYAWERDRSSRA